MLSNRGAECKKIVTYEKACRTFNKIKTFAKKLQPYETKLNNHQIQKLRQHHKEDNRSKRKTYLTKTRLLLAPWRLAELLGLRK